MDKKDYYTSAQNYTDEDNQLRSFTFIDHDRKSSLTIAPSAEEISEAKQALKITRQKMIADILEMSASFCPAPFSDFTLRGEGFDKIEWNSEMLHDEGVPFNRIRDLKTILTNRIKISNNLY